MTPRERFRYRGERAGSSGGGRSREAGGGQPRLRVADAVGTRYHAAALGPPGMRIRQVPPLGVPEPAQLGESMAVRIVRLGTDRAPQEGLRIGTVRRPPRGVPKSEFSSGNWYDVWLPNLAPSADTVKLGLSAKSPHEWNTFVKRYRAEMATPDSSRVLDLLAALSHESNFSVGCYCEDESRCHRSVLRELLRDRGAKFL